MKNIEILSQFSPLFFCQKNFKKRLKIFNKFKNNTNNSLFVDFDIFINDFIESIKNGDKESFDNKYKEVNVLAINNFQFFANKPSTQEELLKLMKFFQVSNKRIMLFSELDPNSIYNLNPDLRDFCYGGMYIN